MDDGQVTIERGYRHVKIVEIKPSQWNDYLHVKTNEPQRNGYPYWIQADTPLGQSLAGRRKSITAHVPLECVIAFNSQDEITGLIEEREAHK